MFAIFPEILQQAEKGDIEAVACLVRKYFGEHQVFIPNLRVAELCANAEIRMDSNIEKAAARLEAWDAQGQFRILISLHPDIRSVREQNYILAHMLGHVFLDLQPKMAKGELQRSIFEKKLSPLRALLGSPESASPADRFAVSLLLPRAMLRKAIHALSSRKDAAAFFNVELALLEYRLHMLGLFGSEPAAGTVQKPQSQGQGDEAGEAKISRNPLSRASASTQNRSGGAEKNPVGEPTMARSPAEPSAAASKEELSSVARVNRSVAARTYKKEGERSELAASEKVSPGMERLRQLARKIDKSVDE